MIFNVCSVLVSDSTAYLGHLVEEEVWCSLNIFSMSVQKRAAGLGFVSSCSPLMDGDDCWGCTLFLQRLLGLAPAHPVTLKTIRQSKMNELLHHSTVIWQIYHYLPARKKILARVHDAINFYTQKKLFSGPHRGSRPRVWETIRPLPSK